MPGLSSPGLVAFVGGNEFRKNCEPMDRVLLARLGGMPKVIIIPAAAGRESPDRAAETGIQYFTALGADAEAVMIFDSDTAQDPSKIDPITRADLLYFTGGDPVYLLQTLRGSPAWEAVKATWQSGCLLAGSSAGAMILGGRMWAPGKGWEEGLGLVPQLAVLPHHASLAGRWEASRMRATLPKEVTLVGIDEATALVGPPWEVIGAGEVAVYSDDRPSLFTSGQTVVFSDVETAGNGEKG